MALIECPECGKEISDKAQSCPHCGFPISPQPAKEEKEVYDTEEYIFCPKCMSTHVHAEQKGFSGGKALAGAVAVGGIGLLAGTIGSRKVNITCLKCGHKFIAGDAFIATKTEKDNIIRELEQILRKGDKMGAVSFLNKRMNWNTSQSFNFMNSYMDGNNDLKTQYQKTCGPKTKAGIIISSFFAGIIMLLLSLTLLALVYYFIDSDFGWVFWLLCLVASILVVSAIVKQTRKDIEQLKNEKE